MAGTTRKTRLTGHVDSDVAALVAEFNKLVDDHDAVVAKVNAILATADHAAIVALADVAAATAGKVGDESGNV
jgi:hypothetical protein